MATTERFLEMLIDQSPVSIQILDRDGMTVRVNEAFLRLFGLERADQAVGVINLRTHPLMQEHELADYIERAYRGESFRLPAVPWRSEFGPSRVIRAVIFPVRGESGEVDNVVLVHEDVTELGLSARQAERRSAQIARLQEAFHRITNDLSLGNVLQNILDAAQELFAPDACAVWRRDEKGRWTCLAARGLSEEYQRAVEDFYVHDTERLGLAGHVLASNQPVVVGDVNEDPHAAHLREALRREGLGRLVAVPIRSGEAVDGSLACYGREPGAFDPLDVELLSLLGDQAAVALHNAELFERARDAATEARILSQTARLLTQSLSLPDVLRALTETVAPLMGLERVAVSLIDETKQQITVIAYTGLDPEQLRAWGADQPRPLTEQPPNVLRMIATGEPVAIDEIGPDLQEGLDEDQKRAMEAFGIRSILIAPLREDGRTIGTMSFDTPGETRHWTERDLRLARGVAAQVAVAIRNARLYAEAQTTREQLEERVRERTSELRAAHTEVIANEKLAALGFMAREVAHGLRNPLNVISTSLYYIRTRLAGTDEKVQRHADNIHRAVEQAANMIDHLTNLAGSRRPDLGPVDLNQLVQRALQDRFTAEDVRWEADWDPELPYLQGDWTQISHAVKALIGNAANEGRDHAIRIRTARDGATALFAVGSRRPPLSDEEKKALFEPFSASATQWTGLGLSVARQIAQRHGGSLRVEEEDGGLTWLCLTLPLSGPTA